MGTVGIAIAILLTVLGVVVLAGVGLYVLAPATFTDLAVGLERKLAGLVRKEVRVGDFRIVYLDGEGPGEPLLLVHGFGADKDAWTRLARHFKNHHRVIALDLPGFGESDSPIDVSYTVDEQVERLHGFVRAIGLEALHIGGNSMGGYIAARYAARHPAEVRSLWLLNNAGVWSAPKSELFQRIDDGRGNALLPSTKREFRELLDMVASRPLRVPPKVLDVMAERAIAARDLRIRQFDQVIGAPDLSEVVRGLGIPTHILWGDEDRLLHVDAVAKLHEMLPQATSTVMRRVGHVPMLEAPKATAKDYLAFRARVAGVATADAA